MSKRQKRAHSPSPDLVKLIETHKRTRSTSDHENVLSQLPSPPQSANTNDGTSITRLAYRPMNAIPEPASHPRPARQLFVCGSGDFGQLGMGSTDEARVELRRPRLHVWFEIAVMGKSHMLGDERGAGIEQAVAGGMHSLVIDELGRVWSWGVNDQGALGRQTCNVEDPDAPDQIIDPEILEYTPMLVTKLVEEGFRAVQVAAGDSISVALSDKGDIRAWGCFHAADGLLGFRPSTIEERKSQRKSKRDIDPETLPQFDPMPISHLSSERFVQIACGSNHVLALSELGVVYCWGNGQHAELGRKIVERHKINGLTPTRLLIQRVVHIAAGAYHSFAIDENGTVYAWGLNSFRQTGIRFPEGYEGDKDVIWTPTRVEALDPSRLGQGRRVVQIAGGEHHTLFLVSDGTVYGCGRCDASELGLGDDHPEMVALARKGVIVPSSRGGDSENKDGTSDDANDAGNNAGDGVNHPHTIPPPYHTADSESSTSGLIKCISTPTLIRFPPPPTPSNPDPPLPPYSSSLPSSSNNTTSTSHSNPNPNPNPIKRLSTSSRHNFALSCSGHVYAWGLGLMGELGLGGTCEQKVPKRVRSATLDGFVEGSGEEKEKVWKWVVEDVSTGGQHTLFVVRPRV